MWLEQHIYCVHSAQTSATTMCVCGMCVPLTTIVEPELCIKLLVATGTMLFLTK